MGMSVKREDSAEGIVAVTFIINNHWLCRRNGGRKGTLLRRPFLRMHREVKMFYTIGLSLSIKKKTQCTQPNLNKRKLNQFSTLPLTAYNRRYTPVYLPPPIFYPHPILPIPLHQKTRADKLYKPSFLPHSRPLIKHKLKEFFPSFPLKQK
jgi:hypothetical protein